jgi:hypothetical protein
MWRTCAIVASYFSTSMTFSNGQAVADGRHGLAFAPRSLAQEPLPVWCRQDTLAGTASTAACSLTCSSSGGPVAVSSCADSLLRRRLPFAENAKPMTYRIERAAETLGQIFRTGGAVYLPRLNAAPRILQGSIIVCPL